MNHVNVSRSCELDNALVGPRCRLEARRAGSVALGRSWSWETTLSGTLNVTRNVESSLEREAASCLAVLENVAVWMLFIMCCLFVLCVFRFFCVYTFVKKIIKIVATFCSNMVRHKCSFFQRFMKMTKMSTIIMTDINIIIRHAYFLPNFLPHTVDVSSLSKFKRSLNRVDFSAFIRYA